MAAKIKRIKSIKHLGIFDDFKCDGCLKEFNDKNIIYGWNYSGKTTLSRLFSFLNKDIPISDDYPTLEFEVELTDGHKITQNNKNESTLSVAVFNSDFVRDNLCFESLDKKMKGITFDVGEGGVIRERIKVNNEFVERVKLKMSQNHSSIDSFDKFDGKFTNEARRIKNDIFNSAIEFRKDHFRKIEQQLTEPLSAYIEIENLSTIKANAIASNTKSEIAIQEPILTFETLLKSVKEIAMSEPRPSEKDSILSDNPDLYNWAKQGFEIYQSKDGSVSKCAFCGNDISNDRLSYLNAFYSNEAALIRQHIADIRTEIVTEKRNVEAFEWGRKSSNDIIEAYMQAFEEQKRRFENIKNGYLQLLDGLLSKLQEKEEKHLFTPFDIGKINTDAYDETNEWIKGVKAIFEHHNDTVRNFDNIRNDAREQYKKYLVASFLQNENYYEIKRLNYIEIKFKDKCNTIIQRKEEENRRLDSELRSITRGKDQLNSFIKKFLNREDILIDVTNDNHFVLKRNGAIAKNLSEGEKTSIAFFHFMVELDSLGVDKLQDTIIFIDDPISSLDANHIAQVSSFINSFFFRKGIDNTAPDKTIDCFSQLFISTHNFEFYSFLKDANNIKRKKKNGEGKDCPAYDIFMIKRLSEKESTIQNAPKAFTKYNSEYVFLFSEINQFKKDGFPEDRAYIMPNIIRRFLEIYTLIKLPGNSDEIDNRIKLLIGDVNELKILHNFSHLTSFERVTKHNELVLKMEDVVNATFVLLEKDQEHLKSLLEGIGESVAN